MIKDSIIYFTVQAQVAVKKGERTYFHVEDKYFVYEDKKELNEISVENFFNVFVGHEYEEILYFMPLDIEVPMSGITISDGGIVFDEIRKNFILKNDEFKGAGFMVEVPCADVVFHQFKGTGFMVDVPCADLVFRQFNETCMQTSECCMWKEDEKYFSVQLAENGEKMLISLEEGTYKQYVESLCDMVRRKPLFNQVLKDVSYKRYFSELQCSENSEYVKEI